MRRHRKKKGGGEEVTLNVTAMLDMAFQLLTFFILTFRSPPAEGQLSLRLPPPQPVTTQGTKAAGQETSPDLAKGVNTMYVTVRSANGEMGDMSVGPLESQILVHTIPELKEELKKVFSNPASPYEQVIVQADPKLRYGELMKVIGACNDQEIPDPADPSKRKKLSKLSFVELNG
ncbi:MAG TPA: biopolymer transporter ExbD [Pirellulales bacterium]|jgi:biopolymer transport protein ExbD|nr:biopolymer transporter ExbD [Pirellulales bacterium]